MTNESSSNMMLVATTGSWFCLHLIGILLASALTYAFSCFTYAAYLTDLSIPTFPAFFGFMNTALVVTLLMVVCVSGLACMFMLLEILYKHSEPFRASVVVRYLAQLLGLVIFKRVHEKYCLPTLPPHPRERLFYLKRVLIRQGSFYSHILLPLPISDEFNSDQTPAQPILSFYGLCIPLVLRLVGHILDFLLVSYV